MEHEEEITKYVRDYGSCHHMRQLFLSFVLVRLLMGDYFMSAWDPRKWDHASVLMHEKNADRAYFCMKREAVVEWLGLGTGENVYAAMSWGSSEAVTMHPPAVGPGQEERTGREYVIDKNLGSCCWGHGRPERTCNIRLYFSNR